MPRPMPDPIRDPRRRARLLALVLAALALAATAATGVVSPGFAWPMRLALLFALPLAVSIAATVLLPREPGREGASIRVAGTARFHPLIALALVLDLGAIGAGYALDWATLADGDAALEARKLVVLLLALPLTIAAATLGTEWALRARLWETLARAGRRREAALLSIAAGVLLCLPALVPGFEVADPAYVASGLAVALLREATAIVLFRAGGLFVVGAWRGTLVALETFGLGGGHGDDFPLANFVSSEPRFYLLRVAGAVLALVAVVVAERRWRHPAP
jgi:hypothetical protein